MDTTTGGVVMEEEGEETGEAGEVVVAVEGVVVCTGLESWAREGVEEGVDLAVGEGEEEEEEGGE